MDGSGSAVACWQIPAAINCPTAPPEYRNTLPVVPLIANAAKISPPAFTRYGAVKDNVTTPVDRPVEPDDCTLFNDASYNPRS